MDNRSSWSEADTETLRALWAEGYSAGMIAKRMGARHTRNSMISKVHRMGLAETRSPFLNRRGGATNKRPAPAPPKPVAIPAEHPAPLLLDGQLITLETLEPGMCKWPHGSGAQLYFCGNPVEAHGLYCAFHAKRAFAKSNQAPSEPKPKRDIGLLAMRGF